ncbi:hypothetical protein JHK85_043129 [Glycine max]|nr:hypothetical protein JHK85_043129 [Glycine max]
MDLLLTTLVHFSSSSGSSLRPRLLDRCPSCCASIQAKFLRLPVHCPVAFKNPRPLSSVLPLPLPFTGA